MNDTAGGSMTLEEFAKLTRKKMLAALKPFGLAKGVSRARKNQLVQIYAEHRRSLGQASSEPPEEPVEIPPPPRLPTAYDVPTASPAPEELRAELEREVEREVGQAFSRVAVDDVVEEAFGQAFEAEPEPAKEADFEAKLEARAEAVLLVPTAAQEEEPAHEEAAEVEPEANVGAHVEGNEPDAQPSLAEVTALRPQPAVALAEETVGDPDEVLPVPERLALSNEPAGARVKVEARPDPSDPSISLTFDLLEPVEQAELEALARKLSTRPPPAEANDAIERRRQSRVQLDVDIGYRSETNFYVGFSTDISEGGIFIATVDVLMIGQPVDLFFVLPRSIEISTVGVVAWVRQARVLDSEMQPGIGVHFTSLTSEEEAAIRRYMRVREPLFYIE